ncbi:DNA cytosine methyltransferase [Pantoea ananatis]|uniref:DNA cytosine methyltransferase n=1 Tax=Pantoea ananas TaxID=553 RepID=UPI001FF5D451|nr:DNA cytosine methyltransferase [Pantoea ananatis]MCK0554688.1 DNA cytosine methyltransferase [Pantoea ananatis]
MNYYNEWDKGAAAWLRELIKAGLIPNGYVDERSITDVTPSDLEGFTQCHFFAGVGGWPLALQLAGVPASTRLWTGSPPCQPFSVAGQSLGFDDERHLAPVLLRLVRECKPQYFFGEQVAAAISKHWLDFVFLNLEDKGYSCGAAVLPACSIGAPHKRDRLFFGAHLLANPIQQQRRQDATTGRRADEEERRWEQSTSSHSGSSGISSVANTNDTRPQGRVRVPERADKQSTGSAGLAGGLAQSMRAERNGKRLHGSRESNKAQGSRQTAESTRCGDTRKSTNPHHGFWSGADWLGCRDGKFRPVESGTFPLAHGIPARVGRLRGYGNAIVPQVAAEFIKAFRGVCGN